jgi:hypothetical protein
MPGNGDAASRLDRHMNSRRLELDLSWEEVARSAEITAAHLLRIRKGTYAPRDLTKVRLERVLRWNAGSIDATLAGGKPEPLPLAERPEQPQRDRSGPMDWTTVELPEEDIAVVTGHWDELSEFARRWIAKSMREAVEELDGNSREGDNPQSQEPNP